MLRANWLRGLAGAISVLVLAGCGSVPPGNQSASSVAVIPSRSAASSPEKLASAHAHFGSALIHEMSDEPEAALQDYYQAVLDDSSDLGMTLVVARKFVQAKQPEKALDVLNRAVVPPDASAADFLRIGVLYSQLGKIDKAIAANKTAIKKEPESLA